MDLTLRLLLKVAILSASQSPQSPLTFLLKYQEGLMEVVYLVLLTRTETKARMKVYFSNTREKQGLRFL